MTATERLNLFTAVRVLASLVPPDDPETEPAVIADRQREEVRAYFAAHPGATVAEAGEHLVLPLWSVERALAALAGLPTPYRVKGPPTNTGSIPNWPTKVARTTVDGRRGRAKT